MGSSKTRIDVLGVGFDDVTIEKAVLRACEIIDHKRGRAGAGFVNGDAGGEAISDEKAYIVTPNPEIVWMARRNEPLRDALNKAALVLPDGIGIVYGARILGSPLRGGRVPGIDFVTALFEKMAETGGRVFLLGAKPGIAEEAGSNLADKYPGLVIADAADGYFSDSEKTIERINAAKPDLLLVCLGAPKQELWMAENTEQLNVGLCAGLGGVLDVFAGRINRAPVFFRKLGLEWLYRIIREPRRIKRSMKLPLFVFAVIWKRLRGKRNIES